MRLSRIEIENFKGVEACQSIEIKPITLLFGPNSAGKSTILQALHYLREILERYNADPDQTIAGGLTDLGGFATLVHNHNLAIPIRLKVVIDLSDEQGSELLPLNSGTSLEDADFEELRIRYILGENTELKDYAIVQDIGLTIEVRWSDLLHAPYVSSLDIELDGKPALAVKSPPQKGRAQLTDFNFSHPLFSPIVDPIYESEEEDLTLENPLEKEVAHFARHVFAGVMHHAEDGQLGLAVDTNIGAMPDLNSELKTDLRDPDVKKFELETKTPRVRGLRRLLDEIVLGPIRIVREYLRTMTYIGPLREIPERGYNPRLSQDESRWAQGLAAWDLLYTDTDGQLLDKVNSWLSAEQRLHTGYSLVKTQFKEIPVPGPLSQYFEQGLTEDDIGDVQELYALLNFRTEVALRDSDKAIIVAPCDVGVGISQMIPVVVGCLRDKAGILIIEQPELHIHPAVQVRLGDLFIYTAEYRKDYVNSGKSLLIETHSEHIILRILRRIRETTANELPPGAIGIKPEDLSVIYVDKTEEGVQLRNLRVDEEGEFIDRWPKGFFDERTEELF